ncbi:MAG TPA: CehA/McbA family metallohydrolase [Polyangia bacterium]|jgi:hypothetical protein
MHVPPFDGPGLWLRGNLHTHTRMSDGDLEPDEVLAWHAAHGYDFVAITDHDTCTIEEAPAGLVALPGAEISIGYSAAGAPVHIVALGIGPHDLPAAGQGPATLAALRAMGVPAFIAHPYWSGLSPAEILGLRGCLGLEVYNTGSEYESRKGLNVVHWDEALAGGWRALAFAADDSHWKLPDHGGGWIMLRAAHRTRESILAALAAGQFYATMGPVIEDVQLDGLRLSVRCSPAAGVYWMGQGHLGWSVHAAPGAVLTEAELAIDPRCRYVRVEVVDAAGRCAWSQAISRES